MFSQSIVTKLAPRMWYSAARGILILALLATVAAPSTAHAYFSTMDTGDVTQPGQYRATLEPQFIFNKYDGVNLIGRFDTGLTVDQSVEALVGFGEVDFQIGGFFKWIPFPDTEGQPAIGGKAGLLIARVDGETEISLRVHPLISKKFETQIGDITAYGSLPFGVTNRDDDTFVPLQIAGGAQWKTLNYENLRVMAELGLNINDSFSYLSLGLAYLFDESSLGR